MRLTVKGNPGPENAQPVPSLSSVVALTALTAALLLAFLLDQSTGSAPVQHLYYLPIIFAAMRFGFLGGIAAPLAAIVMYHVANPRLLAFEHEHWDIVQVALFVAVGLITAQLTDDKRRLHTLASTDDLTGLHNLRSFETHLAAMVRACQHASVPLAVLVLDVDRLKSLNDTHGHLAGAEAVRTVGRIIASQVPPDAVACRYGGDEFVIALPRCTGVGGRAFANGLRHAVYATAPVLAGLAFPAKTLSISIGVACEMFESRPGPLDDAGLGEDLFRAADLALYQAKQLGRNHVCVA
jgi:diguanylate cyclase (GGDEF)-like protein